MESELSLLVDVMVDGRVWTPEWHRGVIEHEYVDRGRAIRTTRAARATNFTASLRPYLHGYDDVDHDDGAGEVALSQEVRFNRDVDLDVPEGLLGSLGVALPDLRLHVDNVELLRSVSGPTPGRRHERDGEHLRPGILAVHARISTAGTESLVKALEWLSRDRGQESHSSPRGANTHRVLRALGVLGGFVDVGSVVGLSSESTVYPVVLFPTQIHAVSASESRRAEREQPAMPSERGLELYAAAAAQVARSDDTAMEQVRRHLLHTIRLSATWSALVLRHGAAYQLHNARDDWFVPSAYLYFRTLHTDALMLARLQSLLVRGLEHATSLVTNPPSTDVNLTDGSSSGGPDLAKALPDLAALDRELAMLTVRYAMLGLISNSGKAVDMIQSFHRATGFAERREILDRNVATLVELGQRDEQREQTASQRRQEKLQRRQTEQQREAEQIQADARSRLEKVVAVIGTIALPVTFVVELFSFLDLAPTLPVLLVMAVSMIVLGAFVWLLLLRIQRPRSSPRDDLAGGAGEIP